MKTIKQGTDDKHCLICCVAMVLEKDFKEIYRQVELIWDDKHFLATYMPLKEAARILAIHGRTFGAFYS